MEGFFQTSITNLLSKPLKTIPDFRGEFQKISLNSPFVEQDMAISHYNVLRGLHYVTEGHRIFTPVYGKLYCVFLDVQEESETKNDWFGITIGNSNRQRFLIPPYVACGYLVLSTSGIVHYELQHVYDESKQRTIRFDNKNYNIYFPGDHKSYTISERDHFADETLIR